MDGILALRGYAVGIAIGHIPGLIQLVEWVSGAWEIRGNRSGADVNHPCSLHGIGVIENSCYGIIRVNFKEIARECRSYIAVILLVTADIP